VVGHRRITVDSRTFLRLALGTMPRKRPVPKNDASAGHDLAAMHEIQIRSQSVSGHERFAGYIATLPRDRLRRYLRGSVWPIRSASGSRGSNGIASAMIGIRVFLYGCFSAGNAAGNHIAVRNISATTGAFLIF
jgi:hypothetical protein